MFVATAAGSAAITQPSQTLAGDGVVTYYGTCEFEQPGQSCAGAGLHKIRIPWPPRGRVTLRNSHSSLRTTAPGASVTLRTGSGTGRSRSVGASTRATGVEANLE
jgi:hypothetical protein